MSRFVPFSIDVAKPGPRMGVGGVLILTQVNFRWIITQRIPPVAYLTAIDKFAIGNLLILVVFACWHAIIGSTLFDNYESQRVTVDTVFLGIFGLVFFVYTLFYVIRIVLMTKKAEEFGQNDL